MEGSWKRGKGRQGRMSALKFWGPRLRILGALGLNSPIFLGFQEGQQFLLEAEGMLISQEMQKTEFTESQGIRSLGWEDPLEKEMATHSSILAWKIPWTEQPRGLRSMGSQRVGHNWVTKTTTTTFTQQAFTEHLLHSRNSSTPWGCTIKIKWKSWPCGAYILMGRGRQ